MKKKLLVYLCVAAALATHSAAPALAESKTEPALVTEASQKDTEESLQEEKEPSKPDTAGGSLEEAEPSSKPDSDSNENAALDEKIEALSEEAPSEEANAPEGSATAPEGSANAPEGNATAAPEGSATAPEGNATAAPEGNATASESAAGTSEEAPTEETDADALSSEGLLSAPSNWTDDSATGTGELEEYVEIDKSKIDGNEVVKYIYRSLRDYFGFNHAAACAVLANARHESNFNYTVVGDGGTSYGIFQWHAGRWSNLKAWCTENNYDWQNADGQLAYLKHELETGYTDVLDHLLAIEDSDVGAFDGAYYMCVHFEKPADTYGQANARGKEAIEFFGMEELRDSYREAILSSDDTKSVWDLGNY